MYRNSCRKQAGRTRHDRRHAKECEHLAPERRCSPEEVTVARRLGGRLVAALSQLPEHLRVVVVSRADGMSFGQISQATGISLSTLKSRDKAARLLLQAILVEEKL